MSEPFFVAQISNHELVSDRLAPRAWFEARAAEAAEQGGSYARYTFAVNGSDLLFECWKQRPDSEGKPRWGVKP
jgi:hypothetical protein